MDRPKGGFRRTDTDTKPVYVPSGHGRWPANVILDETAATMLGEAGRFFYCPKPSRAERDAGLDHLPVQDASKWQGQIGRLRREAGLDRGRNTHPTVKPIELMRWLCRLITPPGGLILDPFAGSGSTGCAAVLEGFRFIGIEQEREYVEIARARLSHWAGAASVPSQFHHNSL